MFALSVYRQYTMQTLGWLFLFKKPRLDKLISSRGQLIVDVQSLYNNNNNTVKPETAD